MKNFFMTRSGRGLARLCRMGVAAASVAALAWTAFPAAAQQQLLPPGFEDGGQESGQEEETALPEAPGVDSSSEFLSIPGEEAYLQAGQQGQEGQAAGAGPIKTPQQMEAEIRDEAFGAAVSGLLPLRMKEIRQLLEYYDQTQEAVETPVYPYPKPEVGVINLSLDPGVAPPEIKLATGHVSTLTMLDVTGAPWPIQDISWAGNFEVVKSEEGGHLVRITPMSEFAYGNLSMRLITLKTPITFTLKTHRDSVDYRLDARVPEFGPFANAPLIEGGVSLSAGSADITSILDGAPPSSALKLKVSGVDGRTTAYRHKGRTYVRTPLTLLSPGWDESVSSADGMSVYALANTPVLLLSDRGRMMRAHIAQEEASDE